MDIVKSQIIRKHDVTIAAQKLSLAPGVREILSSLEGAADRAHCLRQMQTYANIYMPDCQFEITSTERYKSAGEAAISARCNIEAYSKIKYLVGVQAFINEQQEKSLELDNNDFSLILSSRKKSLALLLGPARFANHDCDANARLAAIGCDGIEIIAVKAIEQGDEITVSYGDDYFGHGNKECLCQTCEVLQRNGWAAEDGFSSGVSAVYLGTNNTRSRSRGQRHITGTAHCKQNNVQGGKGEVCVDCGTRRKSASYQRCLVCRRHAKLYSATWPNRGGI